MIKWITYDNFPVKLNNFNDDIIGRIRKIYNLIKENNIPVDEISLIDTNTRQWKINSFLTKTDEDSKFKFAYITIKSFSNEWIIEFYKSKKEIFNIIVYKQNDIIIKESKIIDFRKDFKLLKNKIDKSIFDIEKIKDYLNFKFNNLDENMKNKLFSALDGHNRIKYNKLKFKYSTEEHFSFTISHIKNSKILNINFDIYGKNLYVRYYIDNCQQYDSFDLILKVFNKN